MTEKSLIQILQDQRKYAHYFEWPDKQVKEYGVVKSLFETMELNGEIPYSSLRIGPSPNQAPDCVAEDETGKVVAVEVTEFVSCKAIQMTEVGKNVYRNWKPDEVINEIQYIITRKDQVKYFGGPYSETILLIHTDEIALDHERYCDILAEVAFSAQKIDNVFFLFSYRPQVKTYPYTRLNISK